MPWSIHSIRQIYSAGFMAQVYDNDTLYGYAVCEPYTGGRLQAAWWVLTGRAYAFEWPKPGDIEAALSQPLWDRAAASKPGVAGGGIQSQ
jgi:hypothetical protein